MRAQRRRDTTPEIALRSELHRRGLRFRVQRRVLPDVRRTADIVFGPSRVVVEVRGCFWHGCPEHGTSPKVNADWWREKIDRNRERDADSDARLREAGWTVIVVWEHEKPAAAANHIEETIRRTRPGRTPGSTP